jgi:murein DD-endopeptidase MepM/ murein hydrolase activator NlpD
MAQGDSLYAVARRHNVKTAELQAANGITDPTKIRPGTVLKVPAPRGGGSTAQARGPAPTPAAAPVADAPVTPAVAGPRPTIINADAPVAERKVAALSPAAGGTQSDASPAAPEAPQAAAPAETPKAAGTGRFRWPVKGKVISGFGARSDGTHNDGVNISVPAGTDVHAAENGVVAYAGNELKGYGNLVLIRHENNWVSAYAHNDQIMVKRGDKVKRGQPIAKAGNTGSVDQPQVHFELRQGSKPVDPMPHLEAN